MLARQVPSYCSPIVREQPIGQDEPPLLVTSQVVCPLHEPSPKLFGGLWSGHFLQQDVFDRLLANNVVVSDPSEPGAYIGGVLQAVDPYFDQSDAFGKNFC